MHNQGKVLTLGASQEARCPHQLTIHCLLFVPGVRKYAVISADLADIATRAIMVCSIKLKWRPDRVGFCCTQVQSQLRYAGAWLTGASTVVLSSQDV